MATDMLDSTGQELRIANNSTLNLEPDMRYEAERFLAALCEGRADGTGLNHMPGGSYRGTCLDEYGVRWMFNVTDAG
jgi:PhnB protein